MQKQTNSKTPHKHITTSTKLIPSQLVRSQVRTAHQQSRAFLRYLTRRWSHLRMTNPAVRPYRAQPAQKECANKPSLKQHVPFRKAELSTYMASTLTPALGHPTSQESPYHHPKSPPRQKYTRSARGQGRTTDTQKHWCLSTCFQPRKTATATNVQGDGTYWKPFQHKVDVAMLQGTMELGTYKTIGQHYVIYKHGQQTWSPGYSTGVAIMIHKTKQNHKPRVHNISDRLLFVEVTTSNRHDVYGSAYAPGEWDTEAKRTHFYNQLLSSMQALPARAIKHIGIDNNGAVNWRQPWTGRCTVQSDASPNGQALLDVCEASSLTLANTFFQDPHPCTCYTYGNNQEHSNQIDYIALDCRTKAFHALTKPEWPVHLRTDGRYDHIPVLAKVACQKPSKADKIPQTLWNWPAFQDPQVLRRFKEDLAKVQQEQQQHTDSIDEHWHWLRQELYALQQKHFTKPAGGIRKPYISDQTKSLIHQKAKALRNLRIAREELDSNTDDTTYRTNFEQCQAHLKTSNKRVRQAVTADKIRWVEALGQEAEQAAARNDFRTVFAIERRLCGRKRKAAKTHVKLDSGQPALTENAEQLAWLQHGLRVFGGEEVAANQNRSCGHCPLDSSALDLPSVAEITRSVTSMKAGKVSKRFGPAAGTLKAGGTTMTEIISTFLRHMVDNHEDAGVPSVKIPSELRDPEMIWLWKNKGPADDRDMYRGIGLRHHFFQAIIGVYAARLKTAQQQTVDYWHYGYRAKMSRTHAIFVVRHTLWRLTKAKCLGSSFYMIKQSISILLNVLRYSGIFVIVDWAPTISRFLKLLWKIHATSILEMQSSAESRR